MSNCEHLESCPFFNDRIKSMPTIAGRLKEQFCEHDKSGCARYKVKAMILKGYTPRAAALGEFESAMKTLFPNDEARAQRIMDGMVH